VNLAGQPVDPEGAAEPAPESLRERVAEVIRLALMDENASYAEVADAVLAVIKDDPA
jgi:lipoate-protein ligase A